MPFSCSSPFRIVDTVVSRVGHDRYRKGNIKMRMLLAMIASLIALPFLADRGLAQDYRLQRGDTVQIEVLEDATLSRATIVLPDGQISLPLAGSVRAAGRTLAEVQTDIAERLAPSFAGPPTVFVTLSSLAEREETEERTIDIYILGAANTPGRVEVPPGSTILQAIAAAGGLSPFAATKRMQLRRVDKSGAERIFKIDYDAIERGASNVGATRLTDGDVIVVPHRRLFE
jgi:polysaccharide biosynthesis/export protein